MKIFTVTSDFYNPIASLFKGHDVDVLPNRLDKVVDVRFPAIDLIVFTGGEDVNPMYYRQKPSPNCYYNSERDEREFEVFNLIKHNMIKPKKILGICRGVQLLNVGFGGTLVMDIHTTYGKSHPGSHPILWSEKIPLAELLPVVNSLHHQGISKIGQTTSARILAIEPNTRIIEAICWHDMYFGVQFHPELFRDISLKEGFANIVTDWVAGGNLYGTPAQDSSNKKPVVTAPPDKSFKAKINLGSYGFTATENFASTFTTISSTNQEEE